MNRFHSLAPGVIFVSPAQIRKTARLCAAVCSMIRTVGGSGS
jgi:hypothetical protein